MLRAVNEESAEESEEESEEEENNEEILENMNNRKYIKYKALYFL